MSMTVHRTHSKVQQGMPMLHVVPFTDFGRCVLFYDHHQSGEYVRYIRHVCFTTNAIGYQLGINFGSGFGLAFSGCNFTNGGGAVQLAYPRYDLFVGDGVTRGTARATMTEYVGWIDGAHTQPYRGIFRGTLGNEADGPYMLTIVPYDAGGNEVTNPVECYVPFWVWIDRNSTAWNHPDVIFQNGSYDWTHPGGVSPIYLEPYLWARVPKTMLKVRQVPQKVNGADWFYIPTVNTNPSNVGFDGIFPGGEPFSGTPSSTTITRLNFAFSGTEDDANYKRPCLTSRGIVVTENIQSYFSDDWYAYTPQQPLLDGPRGVATVQNAVGMWSGHSGLTYGCDSFSFWRIDRSGTKKTFSGLRHIGPYPPYWEDRGSIYGRTPYSDQVTAQQNIPGVEIVGNWPSNVPPERRFPWEPWGLTMDLVSAHTNPNAPLAPLPPFGQLPPHFAPGPAFFTTCRFGRILKFQFDASNPGSLPATTEFATGLSDPWGIANDSVEGGRTLYVTERQNHRISKWHMDTGAYLGSVISNPSALSGAYGSMGGQNRRAWAYPSSYFLPPNDVTHPDLTIPRQQNILAPEGLAYQDGWLYYASLAQAEVRRVRISDGHIDVVCRPPVYYNGQSFYMYVAIGDGSFGPRGTIFVTTYDNQYFGRPRAYVPGAGTDPSDGTPLTHANQWDWAGASLRVAKGPGGRTVAQGYATACNISNGMLSCASSLPGLSVFVKATLGEATIDEAAAVRGWQYYTLNNYKLLYGNYGYGYIDAPLPWGQNADCDYWLQINGHQVGT